MKAQTMGDKTDDGPNTQFCRTISDTSGSQSSDMSMISPSVDQGRPVEVFPRLKSQKLRVPVVRDDCRGPRKMANRDKRLWQMLGRVMTIELADLASN